MRPRARRSGKSVAEGLSGTRHARVGPRAWGRVLKPADWLILAASLAVAAGVSVRAYGGSEREPLASIESPAGRWVYPLSTDRTITEIADSGGCLIAIESGSIRVVSSDCPNQICVRTGEVSRPGQWIACLPHRVFIRIEGVKADTTGPDAVSF